MKSLQGRTAPRKTIHRRTQVEIPRSASREARSRGARPRPQTVTRMDSKEVRSLERLVKRINTNVLSQQVQPLKRM